MKTGPQPTAPGALALATIRNFKSSIPNLEFPLRVVALALCLAASPLGTALIY